VSLHLVKLCVGCDSIGDLEAWIEENEAHHRRLGRAYEQTHTTRMVPKRLEALTPGRLALLVVKGQISCRQKILAVRPFTDSDGVGRCHLVLEPKVVALQPRPCRPFQGGATSRRGTRRATSARRRRRSVPAGTSAPRTRESWAL
jgi:hypothetical protein